MFWPQKIKIIFLTLICMSIFSFAYSKIDIEDSFKELDEEKITLNFFDAVNGNPIKEGSVTIEEIGEFKTDAFGKIYFPIPKKDKTYKFVFEKEGFIKSTLNFEIVASSIFFNRFSISPSIGFESIRIVLDWDKHPKDLDLHLKKEGDFHISYRNKKKVGTNYDIAVLDKDDIDGFGPETLTIEKISKTGKYKVFIQDYTNRKKNKSYKLSRSKAMIKVYAKNHLNKVFYVPKDTKGTTWEVFELKDGKIIDINILK